MATEMGMSACGREAERGGSNHQSVPKRKAVPEELVRLNKGKQKMKGK